MKKTNLTKERKFFKPFYYLWAYEAWERQQKIHWLPDEVPLAEDVKDFRNKLTAEEKNLITQIFRFFTQADVEVSNCYHRHYLKLFKPVEVQMMLIAFANMETIHAVAYSHLLDTLGLPEVEYKAFMKYEAMREKHDYMQQFGMDTAENAAITMAVFGGFIEGLQLFASFAILLNFPRFNKLKGMGQIISWSVRDETLHAESIIKLFHNFVQEQEIDKTELNPKILQACLDVVRLEDAFIDLAFEAGAVEGMTPDEIKQYIRYIADMRLTQLGIARHFNVLENPLPWINTMLNAPEHANFFENRPTEYSKASSTGDWSDVW